MTEYQTGKKYKTRNGFIADIRYSALGFLCGHVEASCVAGGMLMLNWSEDGFVLGADAGFDLDQEFVDEK